MRLLIAGTTLALLLLAPRSALAGPSVRAGTTVGLGMRGNQGGVMIGGFRLQIVAGLGVGPLDIVIELDRQIGPDNRIEDDDGDAARWSEWVAAARTGRRFTLVKGLALLATGGVALVHTRVSGLDGSQPPAEVNNTNIGIEAGAALMWQSESLVVTLGGGATLVPFSQSVTVGAADFELPTRLEPSGSLGIGFLY